jgi:hypothetical protein
MLCGSLVGHIPYISNRKEVHMHAVVRNYTGPGAKKLVDLLEARTSDVSAIMKPIKGFVSYSFVRSEEGGMSITICNDKEGTDESSRAASNWVKQNASDTGVGLPKVSEGNLVIHIA